MDADIDEDVFHVAVYRLTVLPSLPPDPPLASRRCSHVSHDGVLLAPPSPTTVTANSTAPGTPTALGQARKRAQVSAKPALEVLKEVPSSGDLAAALEKFVTLAP